MRSKGEENWPDLAYFPMIVLTAHYASLAWERRAPAVRLGCAVALVALAVVQVPETLRAAHVRLPVAMRNLFGWPQLGAEFGRARDLCRPDLIVSDELHDVGEIGFYTPGRPEVWMYRRAGRKPSAHLFFQDPAAPLAARRVLFVGNDWDDFCRRYWFERVDRGYWVYHYGGHTPDRSRMWSLLERKPCSARGR